MVDSSSLDIAATDRHKTVVNETELTRAVGKLPQVDEVRQVPFENELTLSLPGNYGRHNFTFPSPYALKRLFYPYTRWLWL